MTPSQLTQCLLKRLSDVAYDVGEAEAEARGDINEPELIVLRDEQAFLEELLSELATLEPEPLPAYRVTGLDIDGEPVATGVYSTLQDAADAGSAHSSSTLTRTDGAPIIASERQLWTRLLSEARRQRLSGGAA